MARFPYFLMLSNQSIDYRHSRTADDKRSGDFMRLQAAIAEQRVSIVVCPQSKTRQPTEESVDAEVTGQTPESVGTKEIMHQT